MRNIKIINPAAIIVAIIAVIACCAMASENRIVISDTEIVPVPLDKRPFAGSVPKYHYNFGRSNFKRAENTDEETGALSKHAAIVSDSDAVYQPISFLLDSTENDSAELNQFRMDVNRDGIFNDCKGILLSEKIQSRYCFYNCEALKVKLLGKDATIAVRAQYNSRSKGLYVYLGSCLQGKFSIGSKQYLIQIIDCTGNLNYGMFEFTFNGRLHRTPKKTDAIRIYSISDKGEISPKPIWENYYSAAVKIRDSVYEVKRMADKLNIVLTKINTKLYPVNTGPFCSFAIASGTGRNRNIKSFSSSKTQCYLPIGTYKVDKIRFSSNKIDLYIQNDMTFSVEADKENKIDLPLPLILKAEVKETKPSTYSIRLDVSDHNGKKYQMHNNNDKITTGYKICNADGETVTQSNFEYG